MAILTLNAGSSSIKYKMYAQDLSPLFSGLIEGIGETEGFWHHVQEEKLTNPHRFHNHKETFAALAEKLKHLLHSEPLLGIGHRVVHGGKDYFQPALLTKALLEKIQELSALAPIHNPVNAEGIVFAQNAFPQVMQVAVFDTGFHHSMPESVYRYAIEKNIADELAIRRYGFHGINHAYVAEQAAIYLKKPLQACDLITLHLGNGASACLIKKGLSYDTTMGMTPLAGLIMGTRCGDVDPSLALYLQCQGLSLQEVDNLFNKSSGLLGIAKDNDMRRLCARMEAGDEAAILAIEMYTYAIQKTIGAYLSQTSTLDALVFTGGVGENSALIRNKIMHSLAHLGFAINTRIQPQKACEAIETSGIPILVIRGDEEKYIAAAVLDLFNAHVR